MAEKTILGLSESTIRLTEQVLIAVTSAGRAGMPLTPVDRLAIYRLPKWRARMMAEVAWRCKRLQRHELDEITRLCRVTPGQQLPIPKELRDL